MSTLTLLYNDATLLRKLMNDIITKASEKERKAA